LDPEAQLAVIINNFQDYLTRDIAPVCVLNDIHACLVHRQHDLLAKAIAAAGGLRSGPDDGAHQGQTLRPGGNMQFQQALRVHVRRHSISIRVMSSRWLTSGLRISATTWSSRRLAATLLQRLRSPMSPETSSGRLSSSTLSVTPSVNR